MRKFWLFLIIIMAGANLCRPYCLCSAGESSAQKPRIVSLAPSITYTLQQIGMDANVVGRTSYCPEAQPGNKSTIIGNVLETNLEQILKLKPDIVFSMSFTKAETLEKLRKAGIRVKDFPTPVSFEEICEQTLLMGQLTGNEEAARCLVESEAAKVKETAAKANARSGKQPPRRVFFQIGCKPVFPVIEGTYMNQYLTLLGLDNIVKNYKGGGIDKEYVLLAKPDIMLISRMSGEGEAVLKQWMRYPGLPAVTTRRITLIDDDKACCPTPVFFRETLETIAEFVYGVN